MAVAQNLVLISNNLCFLHYISDLLKGNQYIMDPALEIKEKKTMKRPKNRAPSKKREGKVLRVLLSGRCLPRSSSVQERSGPGIAA